MSKTIAQIKTHLEGMSGGASIDDVVGVYEIMERSANTMLAKIDPIETERKSALSGLVYDDVYNYHLPRDYKEMIDLMPQANRTNDDRVSRAYAERFDALKKLENKEITIESSEGTKFLRINWDKGGANAPKTLHDMNSLTADGTWSAVGTASGLKAQELYKVNGNASIEFDISADGDGIQNTGISALDLTDEDEIADVFFWAYLPSAPTSLTAYWGNDLTTNYWTGVAQTEQADGTAFKVGWNLIKVPWTTATETGTVDPSAIDSFKITVQNTTAMSNIRIDQIRFIVGRNFDIKYYSQYAFKNTTGTWLSIPTVDTDTVVFDGTALQIFILECRIAVAQQIITDKKQAVNATLWERMQLNGDPQSPDRIGRIGLYAHYRSEYPSMSKKAITSYTGKPRFMNRLTR